MSTLLGFILRLFMVVAGVVFAASLAAAGVVMLALWGTRMLWARLTGRPVAPFIVRIDPRDAFRRMYRQGESASRKPRADAVRPDRRDGDVTDVEPRSITD